MLFKMIWLISTLVWNVHAGEFGGSEQLSASARKSVEAVKQQLKCIRSKAKKGELFANPNAEKMIERLAPALENGFYKFKMSPLERALFYSQVIEESGGMLHFTENKDYKNPAKDPLTALFQAAASDEAFKAKKGATHSAQFGDFRGRGLIQVSRCDNYISALHYMNLMNAGKKPEWKPYWEYVVHAKVPEKKKIGTVCSPQEIKAVEAQYRKNYGTELDPYGVFENPMKMAMIDGVLQDSKGKNMIVSEQFMVEASLSFWRGKCNDVVVNTVDRNRLATYEPCREFADKDYNVHASKCITKCVKGRIDGWEKRMRWLEIAWGCLGYKF